MDESSSHCGCSSWSCLDYSGGKTSRDHRSSCAPQPVELPMERAGPSKRSVSAVSLALLPTTRCRSLHRRVSQSFWRGRFSCVAAPAVAMLESDMEVTAMLSRATERVGLEWRKPPCPEPSRLDDWFLGVACAGSQRMQVCPYTVSTRQGKPCLLFRACRYSSGLIRRGLCGLWRCCLHLMLRHYCRFFRLKALRDMHGGGYDPEVLKELRTAPDLAPRVMKVMARSLGRAMSTLVVQERHLWLCLVDIGMPTKFGSLRFLYPRLASSATQPVTWPSSSRLHRSRLRRSNTSCLGGQLLPPPVRRLQRPACSSPRAAPCIHPRSRTASAAASKSGAVELGVGRPPRPSWLPSTWR